MVGRFRTCAAVINWDVSRDFPVMTWSFQLHVEERVTEHPITSARQASSLCFLTVDKVILSEHDVDGFENGAAELTRVGCACRT